MIRLASRASARPHTASTRVETCGIRSGGRHVGAAHETRAWGDGEANVRAPCSLQALPTFRIIEGRRSCPWTALREESIMSQQPDAPNPVDPFGTGRTDSDACRETWL